MAEEPSRTELPSSEAPDVEPAEMEPPDVGPAEMDPLDGEPTTEAGSPTLESPNEAASPNKELSTREKLDRAQAYKEEGNAMFKEKRVKAAMRKYHNCLLYVRGVEEQGTLGGIDVTVTGPSKKLSPALQEEANKLKVDCYNNLAACLLQANTGDPKKVVVYCDRVLALSPNNTKAMYRKGVAQYNLKDYEAAAKILAEAGKHSHKPEPLISKYITLCQTAIKASVQREKECYQKMFQ